MSDESQIGKTMGEALNAYGLWTWAWVIMLSFSGGIANFSRKLRSGAVRPFNIAEFFGEIFISSFAGICTFLLCEAAKFNPILSAALIAISGHMGSRAVFMFEKIFARKFGGSSYPLGSEDATITNAPATEPRP